MRGRIRPLLAAACLAVLSVCEFLARRPLTIAQDLAQLARTSRVDPDRARAGGIGFTFDPAYEPFLAAIRDQTPPSAVIGLVHPDGNRLYIYQAWYLLAPRRIVPPQRRREADYLASYRDSSPRGEPIPNGRIEMLR